MFFNVAHSYLENPHLYRMTMFFNIRIIKFACFWVKPLLEPKMHWGCPILKTVACWSFFKLQLARDFDTDLKFEN